MKIYNIILFKGTTASILTLDGETNPFQTSSGVLQGDTLAPYIFVIAIDWVIQKSIPNDSRGICLSKRIGSRSPERYVTALAYADDIALLSHNFIDAQNVLNDFVKFADLLGLRINVKKTEVMTIPSNKTGNLYVNGNLLPRCTEFKYLGGIIPNINKDLKKESNWHGQLVQSLM